MQLLHKSLVICLTVLVSHCVFFFYFLFFYLLLKVSFDSFVTHAHLLRPLHSCRLYQSSGFNSCN